LDHSSLNLCEPAWKIDQDGYLIPESNKRCYHFYNTFQLVNNEIGTIQSIDKIDNYHILHKGKYGIHNITGSYRKTHSDCVQALGKIPINVQKLGVQSISLSAHKIGGPKGIGCLWISDQLLSLVHSAFKSYIPLNYKLNHPVTLNISGIAGFSAALDEIDLDQYEGQMETLNETLFTILTNSNAFPDSLTFNNLLSISRGSSIFSVRTPGIFGTDLMMRLNQKGVYVSTGSACHSKEEKPSQVLQAIGLTDEQALSTIRISMSKNNTVKEVIEGSKIILETIKEMNNEV
jgi:cysteine desulfurase